MKQLMSEKIYAVYYIGDRRPGPITAYNLEESR